MDDLLAVLKKTIGVMDDVNTQDEFYKSQLQIAKADLSTEDIDDEILNSDLGKAATVFYASLLIDQKDIATNPTMILFRNKLSAMTKGARYADRETTGSDT